MTQKESHIGRDAPGNSSGLSVGKTLAHYEITGKLGRGGMGEVYRARDTKLGRDIALKILPTALALDPDRLRRFELEARTVAGLNHPHIVTLYSVEREGALHFITMELVEGATLSTLIRRDGMALDGLLDLGISMADAVVAAHSNGITHRDLKPDNIMINNDGRLKVLDFGLAKLQEDAHPAEQQETIAVATQEGKILGTPAYMSPEQAEGKLADSRSDVFAMGIILFEMSTGQQPFRGDTPISTITAILRDTPSSITDIKRSLPRHLGRVVKRCLEKDPDRRYQTAMDVKIELQGLREEIALGEYEAAVPPGARPDGDRRQRWLVAGLAVVTLAAIAFGLSQRSLRGSESLQSPDRLTSVLLPPAGVSFEASHVNLALSPDGQMLAFVGVDSVGTIQLYMRRMDTGSSRTIPESEGASTPFWSPDGAWIAFHAGGQLKKIEVTGAVPEVIADEEGEGGTWGSDGTILFTRFQPSGAIVRAHANRAIPQVLFDVFGDGYESTATRPQLLPDNRHFLVSILSWTGRTSGLYLCDLNGEPPRLLTASATNGRYVEPGYILYLQDDRLVAQLLDTTSMQLSGDPIRVTNSKLLKRRVPPEAFFTASRDGRLIFLEGSETIGQSRLVWNNRGDNDLEHLDVRGELYSPSLSHSGDRIAIDVTTFATAGDVWVFDLKRGSSIQLTTDPRNESAPLWSPDDAEIYFGRGLDLYKCSVAADPVIELIYSSPNAKLGRDISPDGRYLVFRETEDLWILNLETKRASAWTDLPSTQDNAQFSPDGSWLAYQSDETGQNEIFVERYPDRAERFKVSVDGGVEPKWRGDGKELYYISASGIMMAVSVDMTRTGASPINEPKVLFALRHSLLDNLGAGGQYDVSSDGQRFLLNEPIDLEDPSSAVMIQNWLHNP